MKVIAAYLLLVQGGNASPSAADVKKVLSAVGASADDAVVDSLVGDLNGKNIDEIIAEGKSKMASVGPVAAGGAAAGGAAAGGAAAAAAPEPEAEESDEEMGFGLFD